MPPIRRKFCCVPHCKNIQELSKKQFFKIGANLEARDKWRVGKTVFPKSQVLHCCEDHFDLPNDAINYIRYKYCPGTKLKLRPDTLPHRKLPINVCRLCLNLIYNGDDMVDITEQRGGENAKIIATLLPEIDLSITVEPVVCMKCFDPLERYYKIKQSVLRSEVVVVNCIKSIVKRSPKRLVKSCEIDLFDEYNDIKELLNKEKSKAKLFIEATDEEVIDDQQEQEKNHEEIVIQVEDREDTKYHIVELVEQKENTEQDYAVDEDTIENSAISNTTGETEKKPDDDMHYEIIQESAEAENENVYMHLE